MPAPRIIPQVPSHSLDRTTRLPGRILGLVMAARGARSKKDVDKNIKKQDAKLAAKDHGPDNSSISKYSISSSIFKGALNQPYPSAGPGRYSPSLQSIGSGDFQHGTPSSAGSETKQKKKYVANGKETRAPRGRGGGVPTRKTEAGREAPNISDYPRAQLKSRASDYSYSHRNATSREQSDPWSRFKVFLGPRQCAPYQGLVNVCFGLNLSFIACTILTWIRKLIYGTQPAIARSIL